jgi:hypothetical protein
MMNMNRIFNSSIPVKKQIEYEENSNDISPFYPESSGAGSFVLYLEPVLNPYYQSYQNIITLNIMPPGPLSEMVTMVNVPILSTFQASARYASPFYTGENCIFVLLRYKKYILGGVGSGSFKNANSFMGADDIPAVFSYLNTHGYTIDTSLTKMMYQSRVDIGGVSDSRLSGDRKMIAMVHRNWSITDKTSSGNIVPPSNI